MVFSSWSGGVPYWTRDSGSDDGQSSRRESVTGLIAKKLSAFPQNRNSISSDLSTLTRVPEGLVRKEVGRFRHRGARAGNEGPGRPMGRG